MAEERPAEEQPKKPEIKIKARMTRDDPPLAVYTVIIEDEKGEWPETYGSEELLRAYLKGVVAAARMYGGVFVTLPEIPRPE